MCGLLYLLLMSDCGNVAPLKSEVVVDEGIVHRVGNCMLDKYDFYFPIQTLGYIFKSGWFSAPKPVSQGSEKIMFWLKISGSVATNTDGDGPTFLKKSSGLGRHESEMSPGVTQTLESWYHWSAKT